MDHYKVKESVAWYQIKIKVQALMHTKYKHMQIISTHPPNKNYCKFTEPCFAASYTSLIVKQLIVIHPLNYQTMYL